eukprot:gene1563-biopygen1433
MSHSNIPEGNPVEQARVEELVIGEAAAIVSAFRNHVLSVFGAPAECLVDEGTEFEGAIADLCRQCLIDRRVTSPDSPEGNGLTERVVKTIKFCFKKMTLDKGLDYEWDELLWSLVKDPYDCSAAIPSKHLACEKCKKTDGEASMLRCDTCNRGYQIWCLEPALDGVPDGDWQCPKCISTEVMVASAEVGTSIADKPAAVELKLKEKLGADMRGCYQPTSVHTGP